MKLEIFLNDSPSAVSATPQMRITSPPLSYRAGLTAQYLWSSQQAIEKYLKCILLLNRIKAVDLRHDLQAAMRHVEGHGIALEPSPASKEFIGHVDACAQCRYLEISWFSFGGEIVALDGPFGSYADSALSMRNLVEYPFATVFLLRKFELRVDTLRRFSTVMIVQPENHYFGRTDSSERESAGPSVPT